MVQPETVTARAFWLRADGMDLPDAGSIGRVVRLHDVTSQMSNYQDMRRFHTSVVHKLRTPLIAMHGSFSLLASYGNEMSGAEVEEFARTALQGIERLKGEIDDVLQYINAPVLAISGETIQLQQLPDKATEIGAQLGVESITVTVPPGMDEVSISLTPQALDTILWELFENSTKFHPDHAPKVEVIVTQTDVNALTVLIRDDGVTLSPEQLRWVWTPYIQGEKYFTGEAPGMGLGLALVAALIWHVGGDVTLNNRNDGPGVEVWLHLPTFEE
ncbi:MAG: HAMP domain-containing histidine kinase [Anaerolineales bacterium]|nr:HAMP domain-containing histidine kinase [Anaerolineales bacterium]